jgi:hypothetical protein
MKCRNVDHAARYCFQNGRTTGVVSQRNLDLMLKDKRAMWITFSLIQELVPESKGTCQPGKPPSSQQDAHQTPAQVDLSHSPKKLFDAVAVCIKIWLQVRTLILSQNDA